MCAWGIGSGSLAGAMGGSGAQLASARLTIPHPRLRERGFVLRPLADIAAAHRHPETGETVAEMLAALPDDTGDVRPFED